MGVKLSKNQVVNLSKSSGKLRKVVVGLGWDPVKPSKSISGLLDRLLGRDGNIDCDAFCVPFTMGKTSIKLEPDVPIYFNHLHNENNSIVHTGDNLTGDGDGDDEQIICDLDKLDKSIYKLVFGVNVYLGHERKQHFGNIKNAFISIVNGDTQEEMCKYDLSCGEYDGCVTVIFGELSKDANDWTFKAIGERSKANSIREYVNSIK